MIPTAATGGINSQFLSPLQNTVATSPSPVGAFLPAAAFYPPAAHQLPHHIQNNNNQLIGIVSPYPQQQQFQQQNQNLIDDQSLLHQQQQHLLHHHPIWWNQQQQQPFYSTTAVNNTTAGGKRPLPTLNNTGTVVSGGTGNINNSPSGNGGGVLQQQQQQNQQQNQWATEAFHQQQQQQMMINGMEGLFGDGSGGAGGFGFPPIAAPPSMVSPGCSGGMFVWTPPIAVDSSVVRNNNLMTPPSSVVAAPKPIHHQYMMTVNNGVRSHTTTPISSSPLFSSSSVLPQGEEDSGLGPESSLFFESISESESDGFSVEEDDKENIGRRPGKAIQKKGKKTASNEPKKQRKTTVKALPAEWLRNGGPEAVQNLLRLVRETANSPLIDFVCELLANPVRFGNVCSWVPDRFGAGRGRERRASRWEWAIGDQKAFTGLMNARHPSKKQPPKSYMQLNRALKVYEMNKREEATGVPGTLPGRLLRKMPDRKNHFQFFPDHHQK